jgi:peptidoglycan/xylan/chitin deacetylase (PgdA/CDA1 family)
MTDLFRQEKPIVVLMYHRINDALPPNDLVVPVRKFRQQMEYLAWHRDVVSIGELLKREVKRYKRREEPKAKVAITFDDGYRDNYLNAYPILKELKFPAAIFLITGMIGTDEKRPRYRQLPPPDMLRWEEVRLMAQGGITFGSHSISHPHLPHLSYEEQRREIKESLSILSRRFLSVSNQQRIFCYPYGDHNEITLEILKELNVRLAFTIQPGINKKGQDPLEIKRIGISGEDSLARFKKKIDNAR